MTTLLFAGLMVFGIAPAEAQRESRPGPAPVGAWQVIGRTQAKHTADHDSIKVKGPFDNFRRIKFRVTDAPLTLYKLMVTYENGATDDIPVRVNIPQGGESRVIDLRGVGQRRIRRIDFWYETMGHGRGKADVTVFGMR
jgi:hypothetical protein